MKGALIMKFEYSSPMISVEVLEKTDVLLASAEPSVDPTPAKKELENAYFDIGELLMSNPW